MNFEITIVTLVVLYILVAFLAGILRPGIILFSSAVIFMATGIISSKEMISGFSNTGVLTIMVLFLVNEGIKQSGLISRLAQAYLPRKKSVMPFLLPRIMIPVTFLSAFLNNLPIVVNVSPILIKWSGLMQLSYKKFLIPLSYAAILGGMCTLIGTSSNLVVHGLMIENGYDGMHLFEIGKLGLILALFGFVYMSLLGNWLLPGIRINPRRNRPSDVKDYYYNLQLTENSKLLGQSVINNHLSGLNGLEVHSIERNGKSIKPGHGSIKLYKNDDVLVTGSADRLNYILTHPDIKLKGIEYLNNEDPTKLKQYEVVLAPRFAGLGMTVSEFNFFEHFNAVVLAIHRNGERITANLNNLKLKVGDNVVLLATENFALNWGKTQMFYLMNYVQDLPLEKTSRKKWIALAILLAMVGGIIINELVYFGFGTRLNLFLVVATGALLFLWLKILPYENYTKNVSWDFIIAIASAFAVSKAIQNSGVAIAMANESIEIVKSLGPYGVLAILYLLTAVLTEIITNNAAVALVFPIAMVAAHMLNANPRPFFIAIAISGAASFMTARGYRANLIIKSIGHYSGKDFFRIGAPLQFFTFILSIVLIPWLWSFEI